MVNTILFYNRNACIPLGRISKKTVLAILDLNNNIKAGDTVAWTTPSGQVKEYRVSSVQANTVTLNVGNELVIVDKKDVKTKNQSNSLLTQIDESEWEIISFNPNKREVCIKILKNNIVISIILPEIAAKSSL
jgi:succinylglutamate desuccinylase